MPLLVGIENGPSKGFSKKQLAFTNGFSLGSVCGLAGCGEIRDPKEFLARLKMAWPILHQGEKLPKFVNIGLIRRMKKAGWYTNAASWDEPMVFVHKIAYMLWNTHYHTYGDKMTEETWHDAPYRVLRDDELDRAVYAIANKRFHRINPHKLDEKLTIDPSDYDEYGGYIGD